MAIIWVDPYLDTDNGGIHGTTSSGAGTYASPYSWWDMNGLNSLNPNTINQGDEIRLKGLSDASFWDDNNKAFDSVEMWDGNTTEAMYHPQGSDIYKFIRVTSKYDNEKQLYCFLWDNPTIYSVRAVTTWWAAYPRLKTIAGYDTFNQNFRIKNPNNKDVSHTAFKSGLANYSGVVANPAKITAGWDSETTQNGITYLIFNTNITTPGIGAGSPTFQIDCLDTLVFGSPYGYDANIYAIDIQMKGFISSNYNPGYYQRIYCGYQSNGSNAIDWTQTSVQPGRCIIDQHIHGAYQETNIYANRSAGATNYTPVFKADTICHGYYYYRLQPNAVDGWYSDTATFDLQFRKFFGEYFLSVSGQNGSKCNLTLLNDFEYALRSGSTMVFENIEILSESIGTIDSTNAPQYSQTNNYPDGIQVIYGNNAPSRRSLTDTTMYKCYSNSSSILKTLSPSYGDYTGAWYNELILENPGETIDTISKSPAKVREVGASDQFDSSGAKLFIAYESSSGNAVNMIPRRYVAGNSTATAMALEYKSPTAFPGKTCWRLFGEANGYAYSQMYRLPVPNFANSTSTYTFSTTFNTTSSPGVDITINLYAYTLNDGLKVIKTYTPTVSGTNIIFSGTITAGELRSNLVTQLFAEVIMTKTSTANCSVAFNSFDLS